MSKANLPLTVTWFLGDGKINVLLEGSKDWLLHYSFRVPVLNVDF